MPLHIQDKYIEKMIHQAANATKSDPLAEIAAGMRLRLQELGIKQESQNNNPQKESLGALRKRLMDEANCEGFDLTPYLPEREPAREGPAFK